MSTDASPTIHRHICLVGLDGLRSDLLSREQVAPDLNAFFRAGGRVPLRTDVPTISGPAWSSILTGASYAEHGVSDNEFRANRLYLHPDLLTRAWAQSPRARTVAMSTWPALVDPAGPGPVIMWRADQQAAGRHRVVIRDGETHGYRGADAEIAKAMELVLHPAVDSPDAVFVYFGEVDEAGHLYGGLSPQYEEAFRRVDELFGRVVDAIARRTAQHAEQWLVVVTTDHGHLDDGGHGGGEEIVTTTFAGAAVIESGRLRPHAALIDVTEPTRIAPMLLNFLAGDHDGSGSAGER